MGAASGTYDLCKHLDKDYRWDAAGWDHSATRFNELVDDDARVDPGEQPQQTLRQRDLSLSIILRQAAAVREAGDVQDLARLNSLQLPMAGAWVTALPLPENVIDPEAFRAVVRLRLGLVMYRDDVRCGQCAVSMDQYGIHALNCKHGGCTIRRHDRLRDLVGTLGSKAGLAPALEPKHIVLGGTKPADIFFPIGIGDGRARAVDCVVANPLASSHVQGAARAVGHAAVKHQSWKRDKHGKACRTAHISFSAFAAEVFGGLGPEAATLWRHLNKIAAERADGDKVLASAKWNERLAVCVQREVGATLLKRGALCFGLGGDRDAVPADTVERTPDYYVTPDDAPDDRFPTYVDDHLYRLAEQDCEIVEEPTPDPRSAADVDEATAAMERWLQRQARKNPVHQSSVVVEVAPCEDPAAAYEKLHEGDSPPALAVQLSAVGCSTPANFRYTVGDCCFDAMAHLSGKNAGSLRQVAVAQVVQDADLAARAEPNVAVWSRRMLIAGCDRSDTWADTVTVAGLARALNSLVVVFVGGHKPSLFTPSSATNYQNVFALAHDGRTVGHFTPVTIPEKLRQYFLMQPPTPRLPSLTCVSRVAMLDYPQDGTREDFGKCEVCGSAVLGSEQHWQCGECVAWACRQCRPLSCSSCPRAPAVVSLPSSSGVTARTHPAADPKSNDLLQEQRDKRVATSGATIKKNRDQLRARLRKAPTDAMDVESGYSNTTPALSTSSAPQVVQTPVQPGTSSQAHSASDESQQHQTNTESGYYNTHAALPVPASDVAVPSSTSTREQPHAVPQVATSQAQPSRTHTESGYSNTTPALPVYTSSEAAHSHADTSEQPHVASQDSAYSADLLGGSQHAVPLPGATSVPSTDTPSESGYQSAPPALPNPVPVWNDIAPCPGFDLPIPETADEWEGLFYPTTTHFSSQGGDSMTAAEAFEYCGRWRTAVRPMLSQEELRKASTLCNRLRSLVQTRLRSAA